MPCEDDVEFEQDSYCQLMLRLIQHSDRQRCRYYHERAPGAEVADDECAGIVAQFLRRWSPTILLAHALIVYAANLFLQVTVTTILLFAGDKKQEGFQNQHFVKNYGMTLRKAAEELLQAAHSENPTLPDHEEEILSKCKVQLELGFTVVSQVMVALWIMVMVSELKTCVWWFIYIRNMSSAPKQRQVAIESKVHVAQNHHLVLVEVDEEGLGYIDPHTIVSLTPCLKALLMVLVPGVRFAISMAVLYAGVKYLIQQTDIATVVMKVISMKFVFQIDELIVKSTSTKGTQAELKKAKLRTPGSRTKDGFWELGMGGMFYIVLVILGFCFFVHGVFGNFVYFREACFKYDDVFPLNGVDASVGMLPWITWEHLAEENGLGKVRIAR